MDTLAPALAMLATFALAVVGARLVWLGTDRRKGVLMLVMAAVLLGNVVVWTL
ncbi:hypothetical protein [uncultured Sphingomonas sp.]|uniref:hypothetical protein n=1 Tax=uncultured Sphingomonas sp. TaxID=158754 RepID=UPI0035CC677B